MDEALAALRLLGEAASSRPRHLSWPPIHCSRLGDRSLVTLPEYVQWTDIEQVNFHRTLAMYPPLGRR